MAFKKNNKEGMGRVLGSTNKSTTQIKEAFADLIDNNLHRLQTDLDGLEGKDRLRFIIDLAGFIIPKLKAIDIKEDDAVNSGFTPLTITLTDERKTTT